MRRLCSDDRAATAAEYGLILAFVVIALVAGIRMLGDESASVWNRTLELSSDAIGTAGN